MKLGVVMCFSGCVLCSGILISNGSVTNSPYQTIAKRNAFNLRSDLQQHQVSAIDPSPEFRLVGITTILGDKRLFMKVRLPGRDRINLEEHSLMLIKGQPETELEVLQIDEAVGSAKLRYGGRVITLTFEKAKG